MWRCIHVLATMLMMAPLGARAADLVVWWEEGFYSQEDEAVRETIAAFETDGKQVELVFYPQAELHDKIEAALEADQPPDFAFGTRIALHIGQWAFDDRLVDLSDAIGHFSDLFDPDALAWWSLLNQETGQRALYALPWGRSSNHIHVWKSLLEQAGFTLDDIPKEWDAFWSFWCDQVQPAVRRITGRHDIWGVGLNMSDQAPDTQNQFFQFLSAYDADYVAQDGRLIIDDPEVRRRLTQAIDAYTAVYRKGCAPPGSIDWDSNLDNNKQFHAQAVVIVLNDTLSIPNGLKRERSEDYYKNTATIEWPLGPDGEAFPVFGDFWGAVVFKDGRNVETAKEFVRFLVAEGWLAHYLDFAGERFLPPMQKLREGAALARSERPAPHGRGDADRVAAHAVPVRRGLGRLELRPGLAGAGLGEGDPPRRRRRHQPRAGGRRRDCPDQADPQRVGACATGLSDPCPTARRRVAPDRAVPLGPGEAGRSGSADLSAGAGQRPFAALAEGQVARSVLAIA